MSPYNKWPQSFPARQEQVHDEEDDDDEEYDIEEDDHPDVVPTGVKQEQDQSDKARASQMTNATPVQKRRRVTRACDECRRKKIKCDGKQPCTHCTVYSYECTYDQPSNRRRNPAPFHSHQLSAQLQQCNIILQALIPGIDIQKPGFDATRFVNQLKQNNSKLMSDISSAAIYAASSNPQLAVSVSSTSLATPSFETASGTLPDSTSSTSIASPSNDHDPTIESMIASLGRLDVDETGHFDYVGHSSGRLFLQHVRDHFLSDHPDAQLDIGSSSVFSNNSPQGGYSSGGSSGPNIDSPDYSYYQQMAEFRLVLPSKEVAEVLIESVWEQACVVLRFGHRPTFQQRLNDLYATDPDDYTPSQVSFLPLVYCFLAVGVLFTQEVQTDPSMVGEGYKYFVAARKMIDITEARDTDSIQVIILMVMFLQNTARLSTCYSYIGIALRAALRLGLHRKVAYRFNPVEAEVRKRIFWTIRKMDIHISAMLGLPRCIDEHDIDQVLPLEIDDEYITEEAILPHPTDTLSLVTVSNLHTKLMNILSEVIRDVYPISSTMASDGISPQPSVSYARVVELENELQKWLDSLPFQLRPGVEPPPKFLQANKMLNLAFCYVKIILYRPFIHYVDRKYKEKMTDERPYACAANCISTSRIVVHLADELLRRDILRGAHLFAVYTIFFSTAVLIYFVHEDPLNPNVDEFRRDAELGRGVIEKMKNKSAAAARAYVMLSGLFDLLNKRMSTSGRMHDDPKRKRMLFDTAAMSAPTSPTSSYQLARNAHRPMRAMPASALRQSEQMLPQETVPTSGYQLEPLMQTRDLGQSVSGLGRASTFPMMNEQQDGSSMNQNSCMPQMSYDDLYTMPSTSFTESLSTPQTNPRGLDMSTMANATSSNIDTMLYFPDLGSGANDNDSSFASLMNNSQDHGTIPVCDANAGSDLNMIAYSNGPIDNFEAQLFDRFLPSYLYPEQESPSSVMSSQV
ncbi:fungal-specific transcription factor domain-containing protein [Lipomyces arxii]|uniref:fungal-specific transcription factor domain-containing protein n=1 Tax=Lipomyces arxii TaxID=56418 RepID=UPI0034CF54EB